MVTRRTKRTPLEYRLERCAAWAAERVDALDHPPRALAEAPDSRLFVILKMVGFRRRTQQIQEQLQAAFKAAGLRTYPEVSDPSVERDTRIYFFRDEIDGLAHPRALFETERLLEDFLVNNFRHLPLFKGLQLRSRQYRFPGSQRVIDLLCEDRKRKTLVGVELKHGAPDRGLPVQMIDYMIELKRLAGSEGRVGFRGIVITGQPDVRLEEDLQTLCDKRGFHVDWLLYEAGIRVRPWGRTKEGMECGRLSQGASHLSPSVP